MFALLLRDNGYASEQEEERYKEQFKRQAQHNDFCAGQENEEHKQLEESTEDLDDSRPDRALS